MGVVLQDVAVHASTSSVTASATPKPRSGRVRVLFPIDESHFDVQSPSTPGQVYIVDMGLGMCSCPVGSSGAPCKHQAGVMKLFSGDGCNFSPVTSNMRAQLSHIVTGNERIREGFLKPRQDHERLMKASGRTHLTPELSKRAPETSMAAVEELEADGTLEAARVSAQELDSMCQELVALVQSSEGFQGAGSAFLKAFNSLKGNPSRMQAAMLTFGSPTRKRAQALRRAANLDGPSAAGQPASVTRPKARLGGLRLGGRKQT